MLSRRQLWLVVFALTILAWGLSGSLVFGSPRAPLPTRPTPIPISLDPAAARKIEPGLLKAALTDPARQYRFIVELATQAELEPTLVRAAGLERRRLVVSRLQTFAQTAQQGILGELDARLKEGHVNQVRPFWIFNGLAVLGDGETILTLASRPDVRTIRADHQRFLPADLKPALPLSDSQIEWNIARIEAPQVWQALGLNGQGIVVATLDTGVDAQHPALQKRYRGYNPKGLTDHQGHWFCATHENYLYPGDGHGHGTHVMGTIVGEGGIGVAPGAQWIAAKAFTNEGYTYDSWLHASFEWVLAPAGDPDLAPDVVNCSWGSEQAADETFRLDIRALRAANIFPVFSVGNKGPYPATLLSPASYPESFAVGATDQQDALANFSSRGPSPWGEIKPEVVAPGVNIRSSLPGGGYGRDSGTSMAAPHVTGLVALLRQADPTLTITNTEFIITSTAQPLGQSVPNNAIGWGRINAYQAAATALHAGYLVGTVRRTTDLGPLSGAYLDVARHDGQVLARTTTDTSGQFRLALAADTYDVTASAFAYYSQQLTGLKVGAGLTTTADFVLTPTPAGALIGRVTAANTGSPLTATITVIGTPAQTVADPSTGLYSLALPPGTYQVQATLKGYRIGRAASVVITQDQATTVNFALSPAPTLLLVDGGAWYNSQIVWYQMALDELGYLYDLWPVTDPFDAQKAHVPKRADLQGYDIVIWSSPEDSPGFVGASQALSEYLDAGGRLFLSGQDIAYWDGGGSPLFQASYFSDYILARFVKDDSGWTHVEGLPGQLFSGLSLDLNGESSANNQRFPDVIELTHPESGASVLAYPDGSYAGQQVGLCLPYRVVYLAFGLEGINTAAARQQLLDRALEWLMSPRQSNGVDLEADPQLEIAPAGWFLERKVWLRNTREISGSANFDLSLDGATWPTALYQTAVTVPACGRQPVTLSVEVPASALWNTSDVVTVRAVQQGAPAISAEVTLTTKTPAPILLVDDDRWYEVEDYYRSALEANGYNFDYWQVGWKEGHRGSPFLSRLAMYPLVIWFTGYDWHDPVPPEEEELLSSYLDQGGRLFLSSQDYLYARGLTTFGHDYLGVFTYTNDITPTLALGVTGNPIGDGMGPYTLNYPFPNWSDAVVPRLSTDQAYQDQHLLPIAVTWSPPNAIFRSTFWAFPFEALPPNAAVPAMQRVVGWLSWLGQSSLHTDQHHAVSGETLTYTVRLVNDGPRPLYIELSCPIPDQTHYVPDSLTGPAYYQPDLATIVWHGNLDIGQVITSTYQVKLADDLPPGTVLTALAGINIQEQQLVFTRTAVTRVNSPDLSASTFVAEPTKAHPGDTVTYTFTLRNTGRLDASAATISNTLPSRLLYITGSLHYTSGQGELENGRLTWSGPVALGAEVTVSYQARISVNYPGLTLFNNATIEDGYQVLYRQARVDVPWYALHLPIIGKKTAAASSH